jgi:DNA polymerase-3 subunit gamma/tau
MADLTGAAYGVTATKRRPQTFDELAGQEFVVSTLKNSLQNGSIAHAYLFSGPRGCGKTSAARILARSLNCDALNSAALNSAQGTEKGPCGVCDNCVSIRAGASMDVIEIDGASNTSVNDVRQIKDEVLFPPQTGRYKIYIIDEVHMLSNSAFNALLKTIEEPPPYIVFIFATTELHKVPATIKSRCQQFSFRLIPLETIQEILKKICGEMGIQAEDKALFWIAKESTGSLRDAFTLFDQVASFSGGHIREELIREKLGLAGLEKINALAEACAANDAPAAFSLTDAILGSGVAIEQLVIDLAGYYRSLMLLKNGITRESLLGYSPEQFSEKVLQALDSIRLEQALEILLACYRDIRYSVSPRFELETAVSKLSWLNKWVSPPELKAALDKAQYALRGQNLPNSVDNRTADTAHAGGQGGVARPLAQTGPRPATNPPAAHRHGEKPSLAEEFRKMKAARESAGSTATAGPSAGGEFGDDEEPAWSSIIHTHPGAESPGVETPGVETPVDRVLRIMPGTVVN